MFTKARQVEIAIMSSLFVVVASGHAALLSSPRYQQACDRLGKLVVEYGSGMDTDRPAAFRIGKTKFRYHGSNVAALLKRFELSGLLIPEIVQAFCDITRNETDLRAFHKIFVGLSELLEFAEGNRVADI
jgi:hypothetical protein